MTPRYLQAVIKGKKQNVRTEMVMNRQNAYWSILPHLGKKRLKPTDLGSFSWEKSTLKPISKEDMSALLERFNNIVSTANFKQVN